MMTQGLLPLIATVFLALALDLPALTQTKTREQTFARLSNRPHVSLVKGASGWDITVEGARSASAHRLTPVSIEISGNGQQTAQRTGSSAIIENSKGVTGIAHLPGPDGSTFDVEDRWSAAANVLNFNRQVKVHGSSSWSFGSAIKLEHSGQP